MERGKAREMAAVVGGKERRKEVIVGGNRVRDSTNGDFPAIPLSASLSRSHKQGEDGGHAAVAGRREERERDTSGSWKTGPVLALYRPHSPASSPVRVS